MPADAKTLMPLVYILCLHTLHRLTTFHANGVPFPKTTKIRRCDCSPVVIGIITLNISLTGEKNMSKLAYKGILAVLVFMLAFGAAAVAEEGCSDATLNGAYGFRMSGQVFFPNGAIQRDEIGRMQFDAGRISLSLFSLNNGVVDNPFDTIPGTYTVNSNCTGSAELNFPNGQVVKLKLVLSKRGTIVHALAFALIIPGAPGPVPVAVHGDGEKLGLDD